MEVVQRAAKDLRSAEYNPRRITDKDWRQLSKSIERFGFVQPVVVNTNPDRKNVIIGGHQRVRVAEALGYTSVPCVEVDLPYEEERQLNIRLNQNQGEWDMDLLANNFDISDLNDWGFTIPDPEIIIGEEEFITAPEDSKAKKGVTCPACGEVFKP